MHAESIDEVAEGREDGGGYAEAEDCRRDDGGDPLDVRLHRPAVPEEGDGDDETAEDHGREALFWLHAAAGFHSFDVAVEGCLAE